MLGGELAARRAEVARLVATAAATTRRGPRWARALLRPVRALRRRPKLLAAGAALLMSLGVATGWAAGRTVLAERELDALLARADEQWARAAAPGSVPGACGAALESLFGARRLRPGDERVERRLLAMADALERLASAAERRGDLAAALSHLELALQADPARPGLADRIEKARAKRGPVARSLR
jgi:tetratricopeptide (TPR) repeat protein